MRVARPARPDRGARRRPVLHAAPPGSVPGALPFDGRGLARDTDFCDACGRLEILMPGELLCEHCAVLARGARDPRELDVGAVPAD